MHPSDIDSPHIHKWVSCSPARLCQKQEHQSQNIVGVDGGSVVSSGPIALPCEKSTVEDKQTPVLHNVHHSCTYDLSHANCTLFCAWNAQKRTVSQQGKKTIFSDV